MTQELSRPGHTISPGTLYPMLHRLEATGLLTGRDGLLDGRRVRRYAITDAGRQELADSRRALRELAAEVPDRGDPDAK